MTVSIVNLRAEQKRHNLILLDAVEFNELLNKGSLALPRRHYEHFARVLRRHSWAALVSDGEGRLVAADVNDRILRCSGDSYSHAQQDIPAADLVQSWVKPKALSIILQKCAEIGVREITLVATKFAAPHAEKPARLDAILENACMQAFNPRKPRLRFKDSLAECNLKQHACYFGDMAATTRLTLLAPIAHHRTFVNGPEGGFSDDEIRYLRGVATGVLLSENVLRSDTSVIFALAYLAQRP
ncbi:MAG: RsmE family RNA methyltransferase [Spirochaetes bacterium]|nr:RsmE family RNA methyltransferase [Spirochaetota bacterium]